MNPPLLSKYFTSPLHTSKSNPDAGISDLAGVSHLPAIIKFIKFLPTIVLDLREEVISALAGVSHLPAIIKFIKFLPTIVFPPW